MNKKTFKAFSFFLLMMSIHPLFAESQSTLEIRAAAFIPSSKLFREIYGNVGVCYQLEGSTRLYECVDGWANFDWFNRHGKSVGLNDPTKVRIANTSFGVKFSRHFCTRFTPYIGIGPNLSKIWLENKSQFCQDSESKWAVGGVLKSGVCCCISQCGFLNIFVDYLYQPISFNHHVNIGGLKIGTGLGIKF